MLSNSNLFQRSVYYKPFHYTWAFEAWQVQHKIHWIPEEVTFTEDIKDWNNVLNASERYLLSQIFRFFTQSDIEVCNCYLNYYLPIFKNEEIQRMLIAFADMETVHTVAYAQLIETINMPDFEYQIFMEYQEMKNKWHFLQKFKGQSIYDLALTVAVFACAVEGLQLFASFAIIMYQPMLGRMKAMGQIVTWSIRDETLHVISMTKLYHTILSEHKDLIDIHKLHNDIIQAFQETIEHEDKFIDLAFAECKIDGLSGYDVKQYVRYIADIRLSQLGIHALYNIEKNPLPWMDIILQTTEFVNFFENRVTEYAKATTRGSWSDVF